MYNEPIGNSHLILMCTLRSILFLRVSADGLDGTVWWEKIKLT